MGFMMLLVIGVVVIIALKIAHIPRSATVSALADFFRSSACLEEIVCVVMMQPLDALSSHQSQLMCWLQSHAGRADDGSL